MSEYLLYQFQYEADTFKRTLDFLMAENNFLKNRAAQVIKNTFEDDLLDKVKIFQGRFITEDELIALLKNDIDELQELMERQELMADEMSIEQAGKMIRKMAYNIENTEKQFIKLRSEFNNFLLETVEDEKK